MICHKLTCYIYNHPKLYSFSISHYNGMLIFIDAFHITCIGLIGATFLMFVWHEILDYNMRLF